MVDENPSTFDLNMGKTIRLIRHQRGISLTEAGAMVGVTYQQMQKYEKGVNRISASTLYRFAKHMRCPLSLFFENVGEVQSTTNTHIARGRGDVLDAQALARIENEDVRLSINALIATIVEQQIDKPIGSPNAPHLRRFKRPKKPSPPE